MNINPNRLKRRNTQQLYSSQFNHPTLQNLDSNRLSQINENPNSNKNKNEMNRIVDTEKEDNDFILIKSIESISEVSYKISDSKSKIGRHSSNNIVIFDESVSRLHAQIDKTTSGFYLRDMSSTTGTFIKINTPVELKPNVIIEFGSYQILVKQVYIKDDSNRENNQDISFVDFEIYESPDETGVNKFRLYNGSSIGRKTNCSLCFNEDLHMSNLHCQIQLISIHDFYLSNF